MLEACERMADFISELDETRFLNSELHQAAVLQKLSVIGEGASRVSKSLREAHPEIEWRAMVGFRNIAVHAYFSIQWEIVWATAQNDIPLLWAQLQTLSEDLGP